MSRTEVSAVSLDVSVFNRVVDSGDVDTKIRLIKELAAFVKDLETPKAESELIMPVFLKLAHDPVAMVRSELAKELVDVSSLAADILFAIIADENHIALPFLSATTALDDSRVRAIMKVGDAARQLVLATRPDLPASEIANIVSKGDDNLCIALLDNVDIALEPNDFRRLYMRFRDQPDVTERLLQRQDLPLEVRILQAKRVANRAHTIMAERGWLPVNDAEDIVVDAEESTLVKILEAAPQAELDRVIPVLCKKDMLTPSIILRLACRGHIGIAASAISFLSSVPMVKLNRIIDFGHPAQLKSVFGRAGLPRPCHYILQATIDVARDHHGIKGISPDQFGRYVVEALMTQYDNLDISTKSNLLDIVARACDERTRAIARKLKDGLERAA